jgi:hypothetical protein
MELLEDLGRGDSGFAHLTDQFALRLDEFVRVRGRQSFHERRVARDLVVDCRLHWGGLGLLGDKRPVGTSGPHRLPKKAKHRSALPSSPIT